ncbi:MAG: diguanylate cyclase [Pseudobdellovibrionaceae bacterium]|nr:diguanylate cyclase [Bdellovibrionales bacterium]USN47675.1 MAG: diguanylate cyclase [Pseudobdellovibrionaceae bacterium]
MAGKKKKKKNLELVQADTASFNMLESSYNQDMKLARSMEAVLITIRGPHQGKKVSLKGGHLVLGRSEDADIMLDDPAVSKRHAIIIAVEGQHYIEDLHSTNGVRINRKKIEEKTLLKKEDLISIGTSIFKYLPAGEVEIMYLGELQQAAHMDRLTGIYNQNYITEALEAEVKRARVLDSRLALILFDVDNFKQINDSYGHAAGDYVLSAMVSAIKEENLRESDIFGRQGGDEFAILMLNGSARAAVKLCEQILKTVSRKKFIFEDKEIRVSVSMGVAVIQQHMKSPKAFYQSADKALYYSKKNGRNCASLTVGQSDVTGLISQFKFRLQDKHKSIIFNDAEAGVYKIINEYTGKVDKTKAETQRKAS